MMKANYVGRVEHSVRESAVPCRGCCDKRNSVRLDQKSGIARIASEKSVYSV